MSGDFYVVVPAADDSTLIAVGDVAGRGLDAAKRAWYVRTLIASSADVTEDPATLLERANRGLIADAGFGSPFVTAACVLFHPDGEIEWALAGHDGPMHLDAAERLQGDGTLRAAARGSGRARLRDVAGEALAGRRPAPLHRRAHRGATPQRADGHRLRALRRGEDRRALLAGADGATSADVLERMRDEVKDFSGGELADDLCMVALRLTADADATEVCSPDRTEIPAIRIGAKFLRWAV